MRSNAAVVVMLFVVATVIGVSVLGVAVLFVFGWFALNAALAPQAGVPPATSPPGLAAPVTKPDRSDPGPQLLAGPGPSAEEREQRRLVAVATERQIIAAHRDPQPTPGPELVTFKGPRYVLGLAFSPDSALLAACESALFAEGESAKTIRIWELCTGKEKQRLRGHSDEVNSLAFSPRWPAARLGE
jgi:hypothetical protein